MKKCRVRRYLLIGQRSSITAHHLLGTRGVEGVCGCVSGASPVDLSTVHFARVDSDSRGVSVFQWSRVILIALLVARMDAED
jgi:hypothetical protein